MKKHEPKGAEAQRKPPAVSGAALTRHGGFQAQIDQSPRMLAQRRAIDALFGESIQRRSDGRAAPVNETGMPDQLEAGIEALSGMNMSAVRVHHNSDKPAQLSALAYAQGNDIHLAPGQEQHLPHEAWHVVQQRQGRVRETMQMAGVGLNDEVELEREADSVGARAAQRGASMNRVGEMPAADGAPPGALVQLTAATDTTAAETNRVHLKDKTFPGLSISLGNAIIGVEQKVEEYAAKNNPTDPPPEHAISQAAEGMLIMTQNIIEQSDAKWQEADLIDALQQAHAQNIPIPSRNNTTDPDVEVRDQNKGGAVTGYEVKAVNSDTTGSVTSRILDADTQLGARNTQRALLVGPAATLRPQLAQSNIVIWIAHRDNKWPGVPGFNNRVKNADVVANVESQLSGMNIAHATRIELFMVRVPAGHPAGGKAVDVVATRVNTGASWKAVVTKDW